MPVATNSMKSEKPADPVRRSYLDHAATAPFDQRLAAVMAQASWANANSLYAEGRAARQQLEDARRRIARALGARQPGEIVFTSGGSESDNMAIAGLLPVNAKATDLCVITSNIEHHAVLDAAAGLKARGVHVSQVGADRNGIVTPEALQAAIDKAQGQGLKVALVCVMALNNELGTIQPVRQLAQAAHEAKALFFTDAVQALGKLDINLEESGVDAASFSAHKIGALKGTGALYLRRGVRCGALIRGGGQESGLRSGTSNVMGALAFAQAVEYACAERQQYWDHAAQLRERVLDALPTIQASHSLAPTLDGTDAQAPHVLSLLCDGLEGETLVQRLDADGIAASSGSACSTGSLDPSHVITAIGIPKQKAYGSLRLSFGPNTSDADIDLLIEKLPHVLR